MDQTNRIPALRDLSLELNFTLIASQWSDLAIARTTPVLFGLFSLVTLMADRLIKGKAKLIRTATWYAKERPTFSDAIAIVKRCLWGGCHFSTSRSNSNVLKAPRSLPERLTDAVCYTA